MWSDNNFYEKNKNKEGIKKRIKNHFEKTKWDPESSSGWHDVSKKKECDPESFFNASAYEEAQRSGWHDVSKKKND